MALQLRFTLDLNSSAAVKAALDGVKRGVQNKVIKAAVQKQARAAAKVAKEHTPRGASGALKKSIGFIYRSYQSRTVWVFVIGSRKDGFDDWQPTVGKTGQVEYRRHVPHKIAHLAEYGRQALVPTAAKILSFVSLKGNRWQKRKRKEGPVVYTPRVKESRQSFFMRRGYTYLLGKKSAIMADIVAGIYAEARKYQAKGKSIYLK